MSTSVSHILLSNGFSPLPQFSGLTKNMRKNRNRKIKHAALHGGSGGIAALLSSAEFNTYTNPARLGNKSNAPQQKQLVSALPGSGTGAGTGGWGRLPNVSQIDYADDDPRGWTHVGRNKRQRKCMIYDEEI